LPSSSAARMLTPVVLPFGRAIEPTSPNPTKSSDIATIGIRWTAVRPRPLVSANEIGLGKSAGCIGAENTASKMVLLEVGMAARSGALG
jgi:hypothetical protein